VARRPARMPGKTAPETWTAVRDGCGHWRVVNVRGEDPLRDPDRLVRLTNTYLAAAAPDLADVLEQLTLRFERKGPLDRCDQRLVMMCWGALAVSRPSIHAITQAMEQRWQQELELDRKQDLA